MEHVNIFHVVTVATEVGQRDVVKQGSIPRDDAAPYQL